MDLKFLQWEIAFFQFKNFSGKLTFDKFMGQTINLLLHNFLLWQKKKRDTKLSFTLIKENFKQ